MTAGRCKGGEGDGRGVLRLRARGQRHEAALRPAAAAAAAAKKKKKKKKKKKEKNKLVRPSSAVLPSDADGRTRFRSSGR